jgi:hypothetical protein
MISFLMLSSFLSLIINAFGANRTNHPSREERGLRLLIANKEKLEVLEARTIAFL